MQPAGASELSAAVARKGNVLRTFAAVAWSFFGVRKSSAQQRDLSELNPLHVIAAGIVSAALFVLALVLIVRWVVASSPGA
jgi:hypothetical protein